MRYATRGQDGGAERVGVEFEKPATWVYGIRGGKVVRLQTFTDRAEALEAAGLER